jgi:hypothetical protein
MSTLRHRGKHGNTCRLITRLPHKSRQKWQCPSLATGATCPEKRQNWQCPLPAGSAVCPETRQIRQYATATSSLPSNPGSIGNATCSPHFPQTSARPSSTPAFQSCGRSPRIPCLFLRALRDNSVSSVLNPSPQDGTLLPDSYLPRLCLLIKKFGAKTPALSYRDEAPRARRRHQLHR